MKFAFSTIACHDWSLDKIISKASEWGFDGVELRGVAGEVDIIKLPAFALKNAANIRNRFRDAGVEAAFIATSCKYHFPDSLERFNQIEQTKKYIELAAELGIASIRILGDRIPEKMKRSQVAPYIAEAMHAVGEFAFDFGVQLLIETHGDFASSQHILELVNQADSKNIGFLWDMHNTYRIAGETPEFSWRLLGDRVGWIHIKDSESFDNEFGFRYTRLGEGDIPYKKMLEVLNNAGYGGYISIEWERMWMPELEPPEIVLPQYLEVLSDWFTG